MTNKETLELAQRFAAQAESIVLVLTIGIGLIEIGYQAAVSDSLKFAYDSVPDAE